MSGSICGARCLVPCPHTRMLPVPAASIKQELQLSVQRYAALCHQPSNISCMMLTVGPLLHLLLHVHAFSRELVLTLDCYFR